VVEKGGRADTVAKRLLAEGGRSETQGRRGMARLEEWGRFEVTQGGLLLGGAEKRGFGESHCSWRVPHFRLRTLLCAAERLGGGEGRTRRAPTSLSLDRVRREGSAVGTKERGGGFPGSKTLSAMLLGGEEGHEDGYGSGGDLTNRTARPRTGID